MPVVQVSSNIPKASVAVDAVLESLAKTLAVTLDRPEASCVSYLQLDQDMHFAGSTEPCAFIQIRSIGRIDTERNPATIAALTNLVAAELKVPSARVFMSLVDFPASNWGSNGKPIA